MTTDLGQRTALPRSAPAVHGATFARRVRRADLLVSVFWMSGAAAAALFLSSGGASQFDSPASAVTSLGVVAGLVGTDFILMMLVLAARVPVIDRTIGHDRAITIHRRLGKPALYLLLGHGVLLLLGYALAAGITPIAEIGSMLTLPDMPLAFISIGLLLAVVVTSLIAVRRRFSYEGWHLVHLLSYVSVAFALPHQLSEGGVLAEGTPQRVYWIALYILAFGCLITFRCAEPVVSSLRHALRVAAVTQLAPGVSSIHFSGRNLRRLGASGGQFFIWRFWTGSTWWHSHPISLSAMPTNDSARITVRDLGSGSAQLSSVPLGTRVSIEGPYGLFSAAARTSPRLAVISAGIGVTPVRAFLEHAAVSPGEATVLLRASSNEETYLWNEIVQIAEAKGAACFGMIGPRSTTGHGWMSQRDVDRGVRLSSVIPDLKHTDVYVCGPGTWLDLVLADLHADGVPRHQIHAERFDW